MSVIARTIRPAFIVQRTVARTTAARYVSRMSDDPETIEREKLKNLQGKQESTQKHAPGWNEVLATHAEANVKADKATGTPEEMTSTTIQYLKKQHPDSLTDQIREHTNAPYLKDTIEGPLGAVKKAAKKVADSVAEAAAADPNEVQGTLSDKGAEAERRRARENAGKADRSQHL
ncbi:hypothetical protein FRC08_006984 [Ceratobasidium sp. 394]|nr:hypothetical protein FRC08_006984 [Ceratobasidium sp. 394]KAG9099595.1 hypothetical protein FS749_000847 [Ceratobasidium sp. UAMH 11750]